ncbi:hypothetical protein CYMTET_7169 [Cymbomonas tetramitiformis]|uniref:Embryonic stem cell-specific 5-hydroxymethylcytosine-binding protein n=1 Tax=Cymbomonas tetramitiformis TaxID=36881 RepID=A0AAE0LH59_9CHLO|nr:hypothetical protein CYMTET_7169 [Cymbomonas tetramitiformis]
MCGRTRCTLSCESIKTATGVDGSRWRDASKYDAAVNKFNVSPGAFTPVVRTSLTDGRPELQSMKWGLVPIFTKKDEKLDHYRMMNARSESVHERPAYRRLLKQNRCIVLVNGFYEWAKEGKQKQPYYITTSANAPHDEETVLCLAGLFDTWMSADGTSLFTYTILTTEVCDRLRWLHNRMPVILPSREAQRAWLSMDCEGRR